MPSGRLDVVVPPPPVGRRAAVLAELAAQVVALRPGHRARGVLEGALEPAAGPDAVLLVDGIFLHRPELRPTRHPR